MMSPLQRRPVEGDTMIFRLEQVQNDTFIASLVHTNSSTTDTQNDDAGALYYVIAVVSIYGLSILMMIASYTRKNNSDRKLNRYLKEMANVRKREVLRATARTARTLNQFRNSTTSEQRETDAEDKTKGSSSSAAVDLYFMRNPHASRLALQAKNTRKKADLTRQMSLEDRGRMTTPTRVRRSNSDASLVSCRQKRQAYKVQSHCSVDGHVTTEDEPKVTFSISPYLSSARHPESQGRLKDVTSRRVVGASCALSVDYDTSANDVDDDAFNSSHYDDVIEFTTTHQISDDDDDDDDNDDNDDKGANCGAQHERDAFISVSEREASRQRRERLFRQSLPDDLLISRV